MTLEDKGFGALLEADDDRAAVLGGGDRGLGLEVIANYVVLLEVLQLAWCLGAAVSPILG